MRRRRPSALVAALFVAAACSQPDPAPPAPPGMIDGVPAAPDHLTFQGDYARAGIARLETVLTPANVKPGSFGKKASFAVDGYVYAQPLHVFGVTIGGTSRNVLFVATQHDSVYAFDASGATLAPLWHVSLLGSGEIPVPSVDTISTDIVQEVGITGTPVIDRTKGLLYAVSKSKRANGTYMQRLHALRLTDGTEADGAPIDIAAQVPGTASDAVNGQIAFEALRHNQRSALALIDGRIWIAWASHGDTPPYHGWIMVYDTANLTKPPVAMVTTPDGLEGGIWMGASGPSTDGQGNVYLASGNGTFDGDADDDDARTNFGLSELKLRLDGDKLTIVDWFSPHQTAELNGGDLDFGTMGSIIMPDQPGAIPHRLVTAAKTGTIYILNRDDLGHFNTESDRVVQSFSISNDFFIANPTFFGDTLYVCAHKTPLAAYKIDPATGLFSTLPTSRAPKCTGCFSRGATPTISANGTKNAIVWLIDNSGFAIQTPGILHAYDARDISHELYKSSATIDGHDNAASAVKFTVPVIANAMVYVGGQFAVTAYGLLDR